MLAYMNSEKDDIIFYGVREGSANWWFWFMLREGGSKPPKKDDIIFLMVPYQLYAVQ